MITKTFVDVMVNLLVTFIELKDVILQFFRFSLAKSVTFSYIRELYFTEKVIHQLQAFIKFCLALNHCILKWNGSPFDFVSHEFWLVCEDEVFLFKVLIVLNTCTEQNVVCLLPSVKISKQFQNFTDFFFAKVIFCAVVVFLPQLFDIVLFVSFTVVDFKLCNVFANEFDFGFFRMLTFYSQDYLRPF